ncbi:MAG: methyltransferase domain-containing protein [Desulfuromonadales bacterium]|nr:methyltransferase domain-containing protein [Desulfuromonadales bacterium]
MNNLIPVSTRQVRQHFSAHASEYDCYAQVQKRVVAGLIARLPDDLRPYHLALDIGTGTGDLAHKLQERAPTLPLLVADIAHAMTCTAATRVVTVAAFDADAEALPLRSASLGLVLSASMYQWVNDLPRAFAEVQRVLQPGGLFAFALFGAGTLAELRSAHTAALAAEGRVASSHMQRFPDEMTVAAALQAAGLTVELELQNEQEEHPDVPHLLRSLKKIGAQNAASHRPTGLSGRKTTERMMAIYQERFGSNGRIPATYQVIYGLAKKDQFQYDASTDRT